jgi:hypothetical protein
LAEKRRFAWEFAQAGKNFLKRILRAKPRMASMLRCEGDHA